MKAALWSGAIRAANMILGIIAAAFLARALGAEGYGIFSFAFVIVSILSIFVQFGLPNLTMRETARAVADSDWPRLRRVWLWSDRTVLLTCLVVGGVAALGLYLFRGYFGESGVLTMALALLLLPLIAFDTLKGSVLRGLGHANLGQISSMVLRPGFFVLAIILALLASVELTPAWAMMLRVAGAAGAFGVGLWLLWRHVPGGARTGAMAPAADTGWMSAALSMALLAGMTQITNYADLLLLGAMRPVEEVGLYRIAWQLSLIVAFGVRAVSMVASPRFARLAHKEGRAEALQREVVLSVRMSIGVAIVAALVLIVFGDQILTGVFGEEFGAAQPALLILVFGQIVNAFFGPIGILMAMVGLEQQAARTMAIAAVINIAANLVLIPLMGMVGAALATLLSFLIWKIMMWRTLVSLNGVRCDPFGKRSAVPA